MASVASNLKPKVIVVGGGLAGLMTTIKITEADIPVDLFTICTKTVGNMRESRKQLDSS